MSDEKPCSACGGPLEYEECWNCVDGYAGHDCGEDCCCCLDPEDNVECDICGGEGGYLMCHRCADARRAKGNR